MRKALFLAVLWSIASVASAQRWEPTGGPGRGIICSMSIAPNGDLFVISTNIFRSTDRGASWQRVGTFQVPTQINEPPIKLVWTHTGDMLMNLSSSLMRSTDNGNSWSLAKAINSGPGLAVSSQGVVLVTGDKGILVSTDNGTTWNLRSPSSGYGNEPFFVDSSTTIYTYDGNGALRSVDSGKTWQPITTLQSATPEDILQLDDATFMLADEEQLFISNDSGRSWTPTHTASFKIVDLLNTDEAVFYLQADGSLCRSTDRGVSWEVVAPPIANFPAQIYNVGDALYLRSHWGLYTRNTSGTGPWTEVIVPNAQVTRLKVDNDGKIIAAAKIYGDNFTQWSMEPGESWKSDLLWEWGQLHDFALDSTGALIGVVGRIFAKYYPDEHMWRYGSDFPGKNFQIAASNTTLFVTTDNGIYTSADNGFTWRLSTGMSNFQGIAILPDVIYAVGTKEFYRSTDEGATWEEIVFPFIVNSGLSRAVIGIADTVIVGNDRTGVYFSTDRGTTWENHSTGLAPDTLHQLLRTPDGSLFAATTSGVYQYGRWSRSWRNVSDVLPPGSITSIILGPDDKLYVATAGEGVFRSTQPYQQWYLDVDKPTPAAQVKLFPNPASNVVNLRGTLPYSKIAVYDLVGNCIQVPQVDETLDVSSLPSGQYFVCIFTDEQTTTLPLTIAR